MAGRGERPRVRVRHLITRVLHSFPQKYSHVSTASLRLFHVTVSHQTLTDQSRSFVPRRRYAPLSTLKRVLKGKFPRHPHLVNAHELFAPFTNKWTYSKKMEWAKLRKGETRFNV